MTLERLVRPTYDELVERYATLTLATGQLRHQERLLINAGLPKLAASLGKPLRQFERAVQEVEVALKLRPEHAEDA